MFYMGVNALTFLMVMWVSSRWGTWWSVGSAAMITLPLFALRTDIRPEGLSLLLLACFLVGLQCMQEKGMSKGLLGGCWVHNSVG